MQSKLQDKFFCSFIVLMKYFFYYLFYILKISLFMGACGLLCRSTNIEIQEPNIKYLERNSINQQIQIELQNTAINPIDKQILQEQQKTISAQDNTMQNSTFLSNQSSFKKSRFFVNANLQKISSKQIQDIPVKKSLKNKKTSSKPKNFNCQKTRVSQNQDQHNLKVSQVIKNNIHRNSVQKKIYLTKTLDICNIGLTSNDKYIIEKTQLFEKPRYIDQIVYYQNQSFYKGEWFHTKKHGKGILKWKNGSQYQGQFVLDNIEGRGRICYSNGQIYEGNFKNNQANGYGESQELNGLMYKGYWQNNLKSGHGIQQDKYGQKYIGQWLNGLKHGYGELFFQDGSYYKGEFRHNQIHGQGEYNWNNKYIYKGQWKGNIKHGYGVMQWLNGQKYEGYFEDDKMHGQGKFYDLNNMIYEGTFVNGRKTGIFLLHFPDGRKQQIQMYYNKVIRQQGTKLSLKIQQ